MELPHMCHASVAGLKTFCFLLRLLLHLLPAVDVTSRAGGIPTAPDDSFCTVCFSFMLYNHVTLHGRRGPNTGVKNSHHSSTRWMIVVFFCNTEHLTASLCTKWLSHKALRSILRGLLTLLYFSARATTCGPHGRNAILYICYQRVDVVRLNIEKNSYLKSSTYCRFCWQKSKDLISTP
jgi:hypothetical protein